MKKLFALAAVVAVALTSCVKNEVVAPNNGEVTFKTYSLSESTRADFTTVDDNFECFAIYEGEDGARRHFWKSGGAETIQLRTDGVWANAEGPTYYWPKDGTIDFYAFYHPNVATVIDNIAGNTTEALGMTITNLTIDEAQGLLIADPAKDNDRNLVPVVFRHTTSRLGFYFANDSSSEFQLTINSIVVDGVSSAANYKYDEGATPKHVWTAVTPAAKEIMTAGAAIYNTEVDENTPATADLEVFPQEEQTITIKYTVTDNNGFTYTGTYVITKDQTTWTTGDVWAANYDHHYNITFHFKKHGSESFEIQFQPEVEEWTVEYHNVSDVRQ